MDYVTRLVNKSVIKISGSLNFKELIELNWRWGFY